MPIYNDITWYLVKLLWCNYWTRLLNISCPKSSSSCFILIPLSFTSSTHLSTAWSNSGWTSAGLIEQKLKRVLWMPVQQFDLQAAGFQSQRGLFLFFFVISSHQEEETNPHKELANLEGDYFNSRTKFVAIFDSWQALGWNKFLHWEQAWPSIALGGCLVIHPFLKLH